MNEGSIGMRLDLYVSQTEQVTRSVAQKWIEDQCVTVSGKVQGKNYRLREGDVIEITKPEAVPCEALPEDIPLSILYEDEDLCVVNKPVGMVVHPAPGNPTGTMVNALLYHVSSLSGIGGVIRPGIVHRIDKDTSGLLVVAKNDEAHLSLSAQIASHSFERRYFAICRGNLKQDAGRIDAPIGRHAIDRKRMAVVKDGKPAQTGYTVMERFGDATFIACQLKTGRTHQIRVHMASIGHPLIGDGVYGGEGSKKEKSMTGALAGQCLHAASISFVHPKSGEYMHFEAPLPDWFEAVLRKYRTEAERRTQ